MPNTRTFSRRLTPALGLTALFFTLNGCANKPSPSDSSSAGGGGATASAIVVGEFGSMTGGQATFGTSTDNGIKLAVAQVNKAGGIDGHPLDVHLQDDEGKPDEALTVVKRLITEDKAVAILGEVASKNSIAAAPFCNSNKVPMIPFFFSTLFRCKFCRKKGTILALATITKLKLLLCLLAAKRRQVEFCKKLLI